MLTIGSLFAGIGGLELGLEWAGLGPTIWQSEINVYRRLILKKRWPEGVLHGDVRTLGTHNLKPVDLICGGFPCQDISSAGKGAGLTGSRSGLWFEFSRIVEEMRPAWVVVENVASGARRWVDAVRSNLGRIGYETIPVPLSAQDIGAPHIRRRIFIIAYSERGALRKQPGWGSRPNRKDQTKFRYYSENPWREIKPEFCGVDDGIPYRMDRLKALGNAVVPQCAEVIGWMIKECIE